MNDQIDRYTLERQIGIGGMAEVFLASAEGPHGFRKQVAIKRILPGHHLGSSDFEERFIREARIVADLAHANIVQVIDFGSADDALFIVMEYIDGCELASVLKERMEPIPIISGMHIAIELCKGLDFAHSKDIVHRDISPSNILLSKQGAVKIADFGIAQATDSHKTETGMVMGKWRYMSPEQSVGDPLDHRSDIFAAGVVLFEIFTGRQLFDGGNADEIVHQIHNIELAPLSEYRKGVPKALDKILARCVTKMAKDRYARAKDIVADLRAVCLEERWLPSSDDVANLVEFQAGTNKTRPLFVINSDSTLDADFGDRVADQLGLLGVDGGTRTSATVSGERSTVSGGKSTVSGGKSTVSGSGVKSTLAGAKFIDSKSMEATLLLVKTKTKSGVPVWQSEVLEGPTVSAEPSAEFHSEMSAANGKGKGRPLLLATGAVVAVALGIVVALSLSPSASAGKVDAGTVLAAAKSDTGVLPLSAPPLDAAAVGAPDSGQIVVPPGASSEAPRMLLAKLRVETTPSGAKVFVGGKLRGRSPLDLEMKRLGEVKVELRLKGYETLKRQVMLDYSKPSRVAETLKASEKVSYGFISLSVEPWADIYFKGKKIGRAPKKALRLPLGKHTLRLVNRPLGVERRVKVQVPSDSLYYFDLRK